MVGVSGFEPEASWTRTTRNASLRDAGENADSFLGCILGYLTVFAGLCYSPISFTLR